MPGFTLYSYVSFRKGHLKLPMSFTKSDDAMCAGFGWEMGPYETWDALGIKPTCDEMKGICL